MRMRILTVIVLGLVAATAEGGDRKLKPKRETQPNYILRRQEAYQVRGVPIRSFYTHGRRIDYYRDGSAFEGDNRIR